MTRRIPAPLGDSNWKRVSSRAYQRSINLGPGWLLIGRVAATDSKGAEWGAVVSLRRNGGLLVGLDATADTADAGIEKADAALAEILAGAMA
jgi:hypothetical protein